MASKKFYPGQVNSPTTTLTAPFTVGDNVIAVAEVGTTIYPAAPNICTIGTGIDAVAYLYTGKSIATGAGNLTGVTVLEGTPKSWPAGTETYRGFTKYDQDSLAPIQQYDYIWLPAGGAMPPLTNPAALTQEETSTNKVNYVPGCFTVAGEGTENLQWTPHFHPDFDPTDADLGVVSFRAIWLPLAGTDDVKWTFAGKLLPNGDPLDVAPATIASIEDTILTVGQIHYSDWTTPALITSAGGGGNLATIWITRVAPAGTDSTGDVYLIGIEVKYIRTKEKAP
jgi:hypothetical protein